MLGPPLLGIGMPSLAAISMDIDEQYLEKSGGSRKGPSVEFKIRGRGMD